MTEQQRKQCVASIDKALAINWPPGYTPRLVAEWNSTHNVQKASAKARVDALKAGQWWATGYLGKLGENSKFLAGMA
jgi:hypothetical protein